MKTVRFFLPCDKGMQIATELFEGTVHAPMADELRSATGQVVFSNARGLRHMEVNQLHRGLCKFRVTTPASVARLEVLYKMAKRGGANEQGRE